MIWLLLLFTVTGALGVLEALFELGAVVLLVLHNAVEDLAGKQAAALVAIIVLAVGGTYAAWFFSAPPEHRLPTSIELGRYTPIVSEHSSLPDPARRRPVHATRVGSACGTGDPPRDLEADAWNRHRCRVPDDTACLRWNEYTPHAERGCPRNQLCCPPKVPIEAPLDSPDSIVTDVE